MNIPAYIEEEEVQGCKATVVRIPMGDGFVSARFVGSEIQGYPNHVLKKIAAKDFTFRGTLTEVSAAFANTLISLATYEKRVNTQWDVWNPKAERPRLHQ